MRKGRKKKNHRETGTQRGGGHAGKHEKVQAYVGRKIGFLNVQEEKKEILERIDTLTLTHM